MPLTRRQLLNTTAAASALALLGPGGLRGESRQPLELYREAMVIDGLGFPGGLSADPTALLSATELAQLRSSGLTAVHLTVGAVGTMPTADAFEQVVTSIMQWERNIASHPDVLLAIRNATDLQSAKTSERTGLIYGLQDGVCFETDLDRLVALQQLGVRVIQPTYNRRNLLGDGCMEPANAGLSRTGHDAIARMNELGITIDLSHCGRQTAADAIAASTGPVSFTHTGCYALAEHPRHRSDAEMKAAAATGGVIGIYIMPYLARGKQPTADDVIAHLEHAIKVAGEDHVAIGTDGTVSPTELTPEFIKRFREGNRERVRQGIAAPFETETGYLFANDLNTPRRFETLTGILLERGHSEQRIRKVMGENLQRVFAETWRP